MPKVNDLSLFIAGVVAVAFVMFKILDSEPWTALGFGVLGVSVVIQHIEIRRLKRVIGVKSP